MAFFKAPSLLFTSCSSFSSLLRAVMPPPAWNQSSWLRLTKVRDGDGLVQGSVQPDEADAASVCTAVVWLYLADELQWHVLWGRRSMYLPERYRRTCGWDWRRRSACRLPAHEVDNVAIILRFFSRKLRACPCSSGLGRCVPGLPASRVRRSLSGLQANFRSAFGRFPCFRSFGWCH